MIMQELSAGIVVMMNTYYGSLIVKSQDGFMTVAFLGLNYCCINIVTEVSLLGTIQSYTGL